MLKISSTKILINRKHFCEYNREWKNIIKLQSKENSMLKNYQR